MKKKKKIRREKRLRGLEITLFIVLEVVLFFILASFFSPYIEGDIGGNVTVPTFLEIGNVFPEILNVSIDNDADSVTLSPNAIGKVVCQALIRDYNEDDDIDNVYAEFYDIGSANWRGPGQAISDDNNSHYTNSSCYIQTDFTSWMGQNDDDYLALANCSFFVNYYANPGNWNCTVFVNDSVNWNDTNSDNITVSELLAIGLPASIDYGLVNATYVSDENQTNVTNFGNVELDLGLKGYAVTEGDGYAMNCSLGNVQNISIEHEKYNVTDSNPGVLDFTQVNTLYKNLTSNRVTETFDLNYRQNDDYNEAVNTTYWRIYVPIGVAGNCSGNVVFEALKGS